ncbi:MAG: penicillin-binding protein 2 [Candidatus Paceibacterota bacterium]
MPTLGATGRIRVLFLLVLIIGIGLIGKLYLVQVVNGAVYSDEADGQYVRPNHNLYDRGDIYFTQRTGARVPAATLQSGFSVAINPQRIHDPHAVYSQLSQVLAIDEETFIARATKENDPFEEIATKVSAETAELIEALGISGVNTYRQKWRHYPGDSMAAHSIGFVAQKKEGDQKDAGRYGLEKVYEDVLKRSNSQVHVDFFAEVFSNVKETLFSASSPEGDLVTGLEPNVQAFLESQLADIAGAWNSRSVGGIVMDPMTGQVLAMGAYPSFNPNDRRDVSQTAVFSNPLVENVHEMGSIIKPITMAIGLDAGVVTPDTTYTDRGFLELSGYTIRNYDHIGRGVVSMQEVLNQSLNTGSAFVAAQVGADRFAQKMRTFGLDDKTGIDLPNETSGLTDNLDTARDVEVATASFGQGIAMSPIATTRALAVLANGGRLVTPYIGTEIVYDDGQAVSLVPSDEEQVISPAASESITRMLVTVVDEVLADGAYSRERHSIAAKTGTAQIPSPDGGYYDDRFLHSFFGYAPAYDPEFLVFFYTVEPKNVRYASETLTEPFMNTVGYLINYYEVPPDR